MPRSLLFTSTMYVRDEPQPIIKILLGSLNGPSSRRTLEHSRLVLSVVFPELRSRHPPSITSPRSSVVGKRMPSPCCTTWPRVGPPQHPGRAFRASWRQLESKPRLRL